jgi:hypothetical protein
LKDDEKRVRDGVEEEFLEDIKRIRVEPISEPINSPNVLTAFILTGSLLLTAFTSEANHTLMSQKRKQSDV